MKRKLLSGVIGGLACTLLFVGLAAAQGGTLVAAEYGAGNRRVDVTPQVRSFLHDGILDFDRLAGPTLFAKSVPPALHIF
jgi:hypothetical protein